MNLSKEEFEDFNQDLILRKLEGLSLKQKRSQSLIDYLRKNTKRLHSKELEEIEVEPKEPSVDFIKILNLLNERERIIIVLYFGWEFTVEEVGFVIGVHYTRVVQLLRSAYKKLRKKLK